MLFNASHYFMRFTGLSAGRNEDYWLLECDSASSGRYILKFRNNLPSPSLR
jgi:hypothetical protein